MLPSGNIGCIYTPEGGTEVYQPADGGPELTCDRVEPRYVRATLSREGEATLFNDVNDQSCCSAGPVLDYGADLGCRPVFLPFDPHRPVLRPKRRPFVLPQPQAPCRQLKKGGPFWTQSANETIRRPIPNMTSMRRGRHGRPFTV